MLTEKTTISARVSSTLKKIVEDSDYSQKDAYELGAKLIATGEADEVLSSIEDDPKFLKILKETEYGIIQTRKFQLEKELKDL